MKKDKREIKTNRGNSEKLSVAPIENEKQIVGAAMKIIDPVCESAGIELVHVEYRRESAGKVLRIYIDKPGGISLDDCVYITRQVEDLLDVYLETKGPYHLEVSSPGSERPISKQSDFQKYIGKEVKIRTTKPFDGRKNFRGVLSGMSDGVVTILINEKIFSIPYDDISQTRLVTQEV